MQKTVPQSVKNFSDMPDDALLRVPAVAMLLGCSVPTVWRLIRDGKLTAIKPSVRVTGIRAGAVRKLSA